MKLIDLNLLLYAVNSRSPAHDRARPWLERTLSATEQVVFPWSVLVGFVRLSTSPAIFERPLSAAEAFEHVRAWLDRPTSSVVHPGEDHAALLENLLESLGTAGNLTSDAHLAALAIEHGAELCSRDTDFARFPGLRWRDPLAE